MRDIKGYKKKKREKERGKRNIERELKFAKREKVPREG